MILDHLHIDKIDLGHLHITIHKVSKTHVCSFLHVKNRIKNITHAYTSH